MDEFVVDEDMPVGTKEEFAAELDMLVRDEAPVVFALCEEIGDRVDGYVRYWGMDFGDHVEVVGALGGVHARFPSVERAYRRLTAQRKLHLVWTRSAARLPERIGPEGHSSEN